MVTRHCGEPFFGQQWFFILRIIIHDDLIGICKYGALHVVENTNIYFLVTTFYTYPDQTPINLDFDLDQLAANYFPVHLNDHTKGSMNSWTEASFECPAAATHS